MKDQTIINKIQLREYERKLQFLHRNSLLVNPKAFVFEFGPDSEIDQIYRPK